MFPLRKKKGNMKRRKKEKRLIEGHCTADRRCCTVTVSGAVDWQIPADVEME